MIIFIRSKFLVISSFAKDILIRENNLEIREGGPAKFIKQVLNNLKISYKLAFSKKAIVEIDMRKGLEIGRIKKVYAIKSAKFNGPVLVSTLLDEFKLKTLGTFNCLDVQGYVRDGKIFGKKKKFYSNELNKFDIIKATKEENNYLELKNFKGLLIITDGKYGFSIKSGKNKYKFRVKPVRCKETIGAGDTFFAYFCVSYYINRDIIKSAKFARLLTYRFLKTKYLSNLK